MNDFTKEELLAMSQCLRMAYKSGFDTCDDLPSAYHCYDKINTLIDNYCEHEWDIYRKASIISGIYCQKCHCKLRGYE